MWEHGFSWINPLADTQWRTGRNIHVLLALKDAFISFCPKGMHSRARLCVVATGPSLPLQPQTPATPPVVILLVTMGLLQLVFTAASSVLIMPHYFLLLALVKHSLLLLPISNSLLPYFRKRKSQVSKWILTRATAQSTDGLFHRGESGSFQLTELCLLVPTTDPCSALWHHKETWPKRFLKEVKASTFFYSKHTWEIPREM